MLQCGVISQQSESSLGKSTLYYTFARHDQVH